MRNRPTAASRLWHPATARLLPLISALALLSGCIMENWFVPKSKDPDPPEEEEVPDPETDTGTAVVDGCTDDDVELAMDVGYDEDCAHEPHSGDIDAVIEWSMPTFDDYAEYDEVVMTPVVGQLTDDNGDGVIDHDDTPDIVVVMDDGGANDTNSRGVLRLISGDGAAVHFTIAKSEIEAELIELYPYRYAGAAIGDIDADGYPDIVTTAKYVIGTGGGDEGGDDDSGGGSDSGPPDTQPPETGGGGEGDSGGGPGGGEGDSGWEDNPIGPPPPGGKSGFREPCRVVAYERTGELKWMALEPNLTCGGHYPVIADLDADGAPEVVLGPYIFSGADGELLASGAGGVGFYAAYDEMGYISIVTDLDGDGQQEIVAGSSVYDAEGDEICAIDDAYDDGFPAAADLDGDGEGEFVVVGNGMVRVFEADCTLKLEKEIEGGGNGGPPTIADFDADGEPEIGVAAANAYAVYDADGTVLWSAPVTDASSHTTGSSIHDFEADGHPEVVYADEDTLWIFDGGTGEARLADTHHTSRTLHEYPVIVDVDGDGASEIVVPNGGGHHGTTYTGIYVIGSETNDWYYNRQLWNQHAYNIVNVGDDLSIPSPPDPNWPVHNNFRSGDPNPVSGGSSADAVPVAGVCTDECDSGKVVVHVRVGNQGAASLRADLPVSLYAEFPIGRRLLATAWTDVTVEPGEVSGLMTFDVDRADYDGGTLVAVVDDEGGVEIVPECSETNNEIELEAASCE